AGPLPGLLRERVADDALAAAALRRVLRQRRALAVALRRHADHLLALGGDAERDDLVALPEAHPDDSAGLPSHGPGQTLPEPDGLPPPGHQEDLVLPVGE